MDKIYYKIYDYITELGVDGIILPEDDFEKDLGLDSVDITELIIYVEEEFEINFEDDYLEYKTISELTLAIDKKILKDK